MEVRGFEPLSAYRSLPASTCVFHRFFLLVRSSVGERPLANQPQTSYSSGHGPGMSQPEFSVACRPDSGGPERQTGGKEPAKGSTYAARAKLSFAVTDFYRLFNEALGDLGTQPGLHNTRRNQVTPGLSKSDKFNLTPPRPGVNPGLNAVPDCATTTCAIPPGGGQAARSISVS